MKKTFFFFLVVGLSTQVFSQDLHIFYDSQNEDIRYEIDGKAISNPKVKSGNNVFLHVENYNNYIYRVRVKANKSAINSSIAGNGNNLFSSLFSGGGMPSFDLLSISGNQEKDPISFFGGDDDNMGFASAQSNNAFQALQMEINNTLFDIKSSEIEIINTGKSIQSEIEARNLYGVVAGEIDKLKRNPELKPQQIKYLADEYLRKIFKVNSVEEVDLEYVLERSDLNTIMAKHHVDLVKNKNNYEKELSKLDKLESKVHGFIGDVDNKLILEQSIKDIRKNGSKVINATNNDLEKVEKVMETESTNEVVTLTNLRYEYEAIMGNDFSYTYRMPANGDQITMDVFFQNIEEASNTEGEIHKTKIEVPVSGGIKIDASVGLSFSVFMDDLEDYYLRNDQILADKKDDLQPLLTSYIHFYKQSMGNTSFGGSLGIGFPISGGGTLSSVSFLFGPSLIIGRNNRIVMTAGAMTGQVERLAQGYQVGDSFISEADLVPTKKLYELGYFFGITYKLGG